MMDISEFEFTIEEYGDHIKLRAIEIAMSSSSSSAEQAAIAMTFEGTFDNSFFNDNQMELSIAVKMLEKALGEDRPDTLCVKLHRSDDDGNDESVFLLSIACLSLSDECVV